MTLFDDPAFNFNGLLALGGAGSGSAEVGEVLTAVNTINRAGLSSQTYVRTFHELGDRLMGPPPGSRPDDATRRSRALRAAQYYGQALFFVLGSDHPGNEEDLYRAGRRAWETFCDLCDPQPVRAQIPYGDTTLPVWFFRPEPSDHCRPTVILTNGSDGQNVDMWTYGVAAALERGWNALVYDGPGQGQLLFVDRVVFTPTWEEVVSPLIDWLDMRPDAETRRIALTGLSMGGDLAPRAAAFEDRIAALVAMPGCVDPWLGFPPELRQILTPHKEETNRIWNEEVVPELTPPRTRRPRCGNASNRSRRRRCSRPARARPSPTSGHPPAGSRRWTSPMSSHASPCPHSSSTTTTSSSTPGSRSRCTQP
ncbi:alpha/beta hydrolase family protein [Streptomyces sp. DSM 116494]|uniref:alpha/beta hydrolase family protein n=1 Tax=Streptomyces okerensis TaxID=3344655 RepID=UPI00388EECA5